MNTWIDGSLYPDQDVPKSLTSMADKIDFLVRVCAAWDFGMPPRPEVFDEILTPPWREVVDEAAFLTSCAYHLLRELHGLPEQPYLGPKFPEILKDPYLEHV